MIRIKKSTFKMSIPCKICGNLLLNPGYNRNFAKCCGELQFWWSYFINEVTIDDGRDKKGRFHHKRKVINTRYYRDI